jgi:hypothetical protein
MPLIGSSFFVWGFRFGGKIGIVNDQREINYSHTIYLK